MKIQVTKINNLTGHNGSVYSLSKGINAGTFFSGSSDRFVAMWNLETMATENFAAKVPGIIYATCFIPERNILLAGTSAGSIHVIDIAERKEIKILQHHTGPVFDIKYSTFTNSIYTTGGDGNFAILRLDTLSAVKIKKLCDEKARKIDINYFTSEIAVAAGDCNIRIFDLESLEEKKIFIGHQFSANVVTYSPDGNTMLSGGRDAHLNIWDTEKYELIKSIPAHNFAIYDIVFSPDEKLIASASRDKTLKIWNADNYELLARINKENNDGHVNSVNKLLWSTYNNYLISTGDDRAIMIWDIRL